MLKFGCKELGTNCSYVAQGSNLDQVKNTMAYAQAVHKDWMEKKSSQQIEDLDKTITRMTH
jgi:predicted small metal-binding protein